MIDTESLLKCDYGQISRPLFVDEQPIKIIDTQYMCTANYIYYQPIENLKIHDMSPIIIIDWKYLFSVLFDSDL